MQILFLGAPGSGKGTQCKKLSSNLKLPHLSSGDLLRSAVQLGTKSGIAAKEYMDKGNLVPDNILIDMFKEKLTQADCAKGFILDGFPRNLPQAQALDKMLNEIKKPLSCVINLQIDERLLKERIAGRRSCSNKNCGAVFHIIFAPPKVVDVCDVCGGPLSQRSDDKEELVKQRLHVYFEQTAPLINYYDQKLLLRTVDAEGDPETIFADILSTLKAAV
jgi:adenylate kinase